MSGFSEQWNKAANEFVIVQFIKQSHGTLLRAEAGTGSAYEVFTVSYASSTKDYRRYLAVSKPWERVWPVGSGDWIHPSYMREHWGPPHLSMREEMHGGDLAAIVMCANVALGYSIDEVRARALEWGQ